MSLKTAIQNKDMKELKETADNKRVWHPDFLKYTEFIVRHENYNGLFYERGDDKRVKWVITGKSENGQQRRAWWDKQCKKHETLIHSIAPYKRTSLL